MNRFSCFMALFVLAAIPTFARAQFGNNSLFEPQVDVVSSGILMDAQATVSADRKYVTLTMRPQQSNLLNLRTFQFQGAGNLNNNLGGVVGGVNPVIAGPMGSIIPQALNAPKKVGNGAGGVILLTRGITPLVPKD